MLGKYDQKKIEKEVLSFWLEKKIPEKIVNFEPGRKKFYLLDGPPYVNGVPHVGHLKTTAVKDIFSKLKTMQGFAVWYQPGFDCGGLPIENAVEKKLGVSSKKDIEKKIGVDRFINECKKMAEMNREKWLETYKKFGAWRGWVEPYMTYKNYYLESGWWTVKKMWEKGMLAEGTKPVYWCPRCETTLSGYEVTDSYSELEDYSIYVKHPLKGNKNEFIVIWTTTPWTLPANVAIAVHPEKHYVKVKVGNDYLILAEERLENVAKEVGLGDYEVVERFRGSKLAGMKYEPVLDVPIQKKLRKEENAHRIILSIPIFKKGVSGKVAAKKKIEESYKEEVEEFVTMEMGSGCVHTAPGHGETDFKMGEHYNLPKVSPVDEKGRLTKDAGMFAGLAVREANEKIIEYLKEKGFLLFAGKIRHKYPLCWRCKTPLIYRLSKQWFFLVDLIKERMLSENERVKWMPDFARERFRNWLEGSVDWAISMQRYWGIPLPVWKCNNCGSIDVIGSFRELEEKSIEKVEKHDLHKNVVDKVKIKCKECGGVAERVPDIMNVWFDSGIAPWASLGYPFKNKELVEKLMPIDLIAESQDQIRGWFYSLMFVGTAVFEKSPYKSVAMIGWVLDDKGRKMSKSLGNVVYANDAIEKSSSDVLRMYYCWATSPWDVQNFSLSVAKGLEKFLSVLWNVANFILSYTEPRVLGKKLNTKELKLEDRWIISRVNSLIGSVTDNLENFRFNIAGRELEDFVLNDFSRWYVKLVRKRVSPFSKGKEKEQAEFTLLYVMDVVLRLLAPITPFITEKIYQEVFRKRLKGFPQSIHLSTWPREDASLIDKKLENDVSIARKIVEASYSLRSEMKIKIRWPVDILLVKVDGGKSLEYMNGMIKEMANVKEVLWVENVPSHLKRRVFEGGEVALGKVLKDEAFIRDLARNIQVLRKNEGLDVKDTIKIWISGDEPTIKVIKNNVDMFKHAVGADEVEFSTEGKEVKRIKVGENSVDVCFEVVQK